MIRGKLLVHFFFIIRFQLLSELVNNREGDTKKQIVVEIMAREREREREQL